MTKPFLRLLLAPVLVAALAAPAEAAVVYTKDGRTYDGALRVEAAALVVAAPDGKAQSIPYDQVLGVSLDGQPLFAPPARPASGEAFKADLVTWSVVLANLAAVGLAGVVLYRQLNAGTAAQPAAGAPR